jgi:hypothetical protein
MTGETELENGMRSKGRVARSKLWRYLPLALLAAIAVWYFRTAPKETTLVYDLGDKREELRSLSVEIVSLPERKFIRHTELSYSTRSPAPREQSQSLKLAKGDYSAEIVLEYPNRRERLERAFRFDGEARLTLKL